MNSKKSTNLPAKAAEPSLPATQSDVLGALAAETGETGFENVRPQDTAIPFILVLQALSPQVKRASASRIEGAEEGMFYNNVTQEVFAPPARVIPCAFQKAWVEWVPREAGGGFVARHETDELVKTCTVDAKNNRVLPSGNHLVDTSYHFVLLQREGGLLERAVISLTKSQLKKSRRWLSQMQTLQVKLPGGKVLRQPPMWSHSYELGVALEQKDQNSWYGYTVGSPKLVESMEVYAEAKRFHAAIVAGQVQVKPPEDEHAGDEGGTQVAAEVI